jgi:histidyl-tRNA synthetase
MSKYQAVRGTHDILPEEAGQFQKLEAQARVLFKQFGFQEIRTPTFEMLDLFHRSLGETTDIVEKEMYVFEDRGGRRLALRPEGTAGVVRAFIEHHLSQTSSICKLFYIGSMFRAERPQAGRYREFWQIGGEYFGNPYPEADAELLLMVQGLYQSLGLSDVQLKLNSLGDEKCRPVYRQALRDYLEAEKSKLCEDCQRRIEKNPFRILDCKTDGPRLAGAPTIDGFWCDECKAHFGAVRAHLDKAGAAYVIAPRLVRGLDYYNRTVFEVTTTALGAQDALAAGGRYDRLVKDIGGPDVPALGFALGSERTIAAIKAAAAKEEAGKTGVRVFVAAQGEDTYPAVFQLLQELRLDKGLREKGILVEGGFFRKKLGAQMTLADRWGASHCVIVGQEELEQGQVTLRFLKSSSQERLARTQLIPHLLRLSSSPAASPSSFPAGAGGESMDPLPEAAGDDDKGNDERKHA